MFDPINICRSRFALCSSILISTLSIILCSNYSSSYAQSEVPFILPFKAEPVFLSGVGDQNDGSENEPIANANAITSCSNTWLYDGFASKYYLGEGKTSPNGKWKNVYSGYGATYVESGGAKYAFFLKPKAVTSGSQTLAALVTSTGVYCDFVVEFDMNTIKQLRQGSPPNTWEAGWFIFRYSDTFHYYWLLIRTDGFEFGKKDCNTCSDPVDGQKYLVTTSLPKLKLDTWQHWKVEAIYNHFKVWVDNKLVLDFIDKGMSKKLAGGNIAMYSEDALVKYDNFKLLIK